MGTGLLRDGYWVRPYNFFTLAGHVVYSNRLGEVNEEMGVWNLVCRESARDGETGEWSPTWSWAGTDTFTPFSQAVEYVKQDRIPPNGCYLGMAPQDTGQDTHRIIKSIVTAVNGTLSSRPKTGVDPRMEHFAELLDILVADDPHGLLAIGSWDNRTLLDRMSSVRRPRTKNPQIFSLATGFLTVVGSDQYQDVFGSCRYGARYLSQSAWRHSYAGCFSNAVLDDTRRMIGVFDALVEQGYPEPWADRMMYCKTRYHEYDIPRLGAVS